jgi:hypothetical protein
MSYTDYLRLEGWSSIVLGLVLAAVAVPGLSSDDAWALLLVPAVLILLALIGRRAGARIGRPGEWLTARPLRGAQPGRSALAAAPLRRRLLAETALWIVLGSAWVLLADSSHGLFLGTGLASVAFGAVQALAARRRVADEERRRGERFVVAERPGLGLPRLGLSS